MRGEPEVVVRRQVHHLPVIDRRLGFLFVFENPKMSIETLLLQRIELGCEKRKRIGSHDAPGRHKERVKKPRLSQGGPRYGDFFTDSIRAAKGSASASV